MKGDRSSWMISIAQIVLKFNVFETRTDTRASTPFSGRRKALVVEIAITKQV